MHRSEDHPRIRGTNLGESCVIVTDKGSSPHTRDKQSICGLKKASFRIIPAYAGQTAREIFLDLTERDHPRIRGTNRGASPLNSGIWGSSPHTRDKLI